MTNAGRRTESAMAPRPARAEQAFLASPLRPRRQPKWIAAGVLAMCLGGLGASLLWIQAAKTTDVIVVTRNVGRGEVVTKEDFRVARVGSLVGVSAADVSGINALPGKRALVDLTKDSLLPADSVGELELTRGSSYIGLKLPPGRIPTDELPAGTQVQLIPVADGPENGGGPPEKGAAPAIPPVPATVVNPPRLGPDGVALLLDVRVNSNRAPEAATLAATDRVALVKEGG